MKKLYYTLILAIGLAQTAMAGDWNLAKDKNGIMVYTRESAESPIKEFKAITTLKANLHDLLAAIQDYKNYAEWYDHCKSGELLTELPDQSRIYHMEMAMPFPFSNRDMVGKMTLVRNGEWTEVYITKEDGAMDEIEGIVRMPVIEGSWRLKQVTADKVEVHHQFKGDPAGNIPSGIVNMFLVAGPINTLTQLQEYLNR